MVYGQSDLVSTAAALPDAWRSQVLARIGGANVKVLRMDAGAYEEEVHAYDEGLLVVDGVMQLLVRSSDSPGIVSEVTVGAGNIYVVPAGVPHAVAPGSRGTLVIIDLVGG